MYIEAFKPNTGNYLSAQGKGTKHNQDSEDEPMHLTIRLIISHSKNIGFREAIK